MQKYLWKKSGAGGDRDAVSVPCLEGKKDDNGERTGTGGGTAGST